MSTETNRTLVARSFVEVINEENRAVIDEIYSPQVVIHDPFRGVQAGRDAFRQLLAAFDIGFPHHRVQVHQMIVDGDWVSVVHTHTATHAGVFNGLPPTGRTVVVNGVEVYRVVGGQIVEFWRHDDDLGLLLQLGAIPAPAAA